VRQIAIKGEKTDTDNQLLGKPFKDLSSIIQTNQDPIQEETIE